MVTSPIGNELESDLRTSPEQYTEDLHKEMQSMHDRIEEEMNIEKEALEIDKEILSQLENMMNMYARYENDLITFVTFLQEQPDDASDMVMMGRFMDKIQGDKGPDLVNNPAELPQVIRSIEEDFKNIFEELDEKDEDLKEVLKQDYSMEDEIEVIEKMAEKLETITAAFESNTNEG